MKEDASSFFNDAARSAVCTLAVSLRSEACPKSPTLLVELAVSSPRVVGWPSSVSSSSSSDLSSLASASGGLKRGGTTSGMDETMGPPHTMPHGPQHPDAQTQVGALFISASRKSLRSSTSPGMALAASESRSDAGPGLPSRRSAAPRRISAFGALPSMARAASAHLTASVYWLRLRHTAAKFCAKANRKSQRASLTGMRSLEG
mmetsp:Transcript_73186/g.118050  ORF Transcript_73186/g.118050 Transcript_73186/m.118050 type:complete len:204 (+) Transcript_73186:252-863(+)